MLISVYTSAKRGRLYLFQKIYAMKQLMFWFIFLNASTALHAQRKPGSIQNKPAIIWDSASLRQVSAPGDGSANYARMMQLSNGNLVCVYEGDGGICCTKSFDEGNTWLAPVTIAASEEGVNMSVPDILELNNHSLLVSYNPRPHKMGSSWDTSKHFAICTITSHDGGATWHNKRTLYEAGYTFENGCWEPSQLQLPSGEIQLFFSNEGIYTQSNEQNISLFRSKDNGLTWTSQPEIVSFSPGHRDGMPVPIFLQKKNEIVFSIEDNSGGQFKPSIIRNAISQNWRQPVGASDAQRSYALASPLADTVYAGAPFLRQLQNGQTILSYQSNQNRAHNWALSCMQVAVGNSEAKQFEPVQPPFQIPLNKHGLWNSLCILHNDTIIAVTSTNAYGSATSIWMIKGKLVSEKR